MPARLAAAAALLGAGQFLFQAAPVSAAGRGELVRIVVVSRHGVRAPLQKPEELALWSDKDWPDLSADWRVAKPGDLTPAGKALAALMGGYYRALLVSESAIPSHGCPSAGSVFVRADVDPRTKDTAAGILDGLAPGCPGVRVHFLAGDVDPLFHPVKGKVCAFDRETTEAAILGRTGGGFEAVARADGDSLELLDRILGCCRPELCRRFGKPDPCRLPDLGSRLEWKEPDDPKKGNAMLSLGGTLGIASTAAEIFLLEYAGGFKGEKWGFGKIDEAGMLQLGRLHTLLFDVVERTPYVARREGSELLRQVAAILEEREPRLPEMPKSAKAVFLVGHDTNLADLAAMLGVSWQQPDYQANDTPPAGALVFELRRGSDRRQRVFVSYLAQSPEQMAQRTPLDLDHPPERATLFVPGCSSSSAGYPCSLDSFAGAVEKTLVRECLALPGGGKKKP
jgi:4-phytase/acid phosphatase